MCDNVCHWALVPSISPRVWAISQELITSVKWVSILAANIYISTRMSSKMQKQCVIDIWRKIKLSISIHSSKSFLVIARLADNQAHNSCSVAWSEDYNLNMKMSLVLIASMNHENVVWVINQSDGWVCRTEQLQALTSRVFPVLLIIISLARPGLGAWDTIIITITQDSRQHLIREKVTIFRNQESESEKCTSSKLVVISS